MKILFSLIALAVLLVGCITSPKPKEIDHPVTCVMRDTLFQDPSGDFYRAGICRLDSTEPRPPKINP